MMDSDELHKISLDNRQKRTRAKLSCAECRRLKLKCSRQWPCTNCIRRHCPELCPEQEMAPSSRTRSAKDIAEIESLKAKIAAMQSRMPSSDSTTSASSQATPPPAGPDQGNDIDTIGSLTLHDTELSVVDESRTTFLGPSSASAFATTHSDQESSEDEEYNDGVTFPFQPLGRNDWAGLIAALPSRHEAERLSSVYYSTYATFFELLPQDAFRALYLQGAYGKSVQRIRLSTATGMNPVDIQRLAVVYAVLAIGALLDSSKPARSPQARILFLAAQRALGATHFMFSPSLTSLQALNLFASFIFIYHSHSAKAAWQCCGLMMHALIDQGCHRDGSNFKLSGPVLDARRALFYDSLVFDQQLAMLLGRPYSLSTDHYDTQLPTTANSPFHLYKWKFHSLMVRVADVGLMSRLDYSLISTLDKDVRAFYDSVTADFQLDPEGQTEERPMRTILQAHYLALSVHKSLLSLHRRHFYHAIQHSPEEPLQSPYAESVIAVVLDITRKILNIAQAALYHYPTLAKRLPSLVIHVFGSGVCLGLLCAKAPHSLLAPRSLTDLAVALEFIRAAKDESAIAAEVLPRLEQLYTQASASPPPALSPRLSLNPEIIGRLAVHDPYLSIQANSQGRSQVEKTALELPVNEPDPPLFTTPPLYNTNMQDFSAMGLPSSLFGFESPAFSINESVGDPLSGGDASWDFYNYLPSATPSSGAMSNQALADDAFLQDLSNPGTFSWPAQDTSANPTYPMY